MNVIYKKQEGQKNKPVVWGVQLSQEMTTDIAKYARKHGIAEADVFREALAKYLKGSRARL